MSHIPEPKPKRSRVAHQNPQPRDQNLRPKFSGAVGGASPKYKLTRKQRRFVEEYAKDFCGAKAAVRAGYSKNTARQIASENLTKPYIQAEIQNILNQLQAQSLGPKSTLLEKLAFIANVSLGDVVCLKSLQVKPNTSAELIAVKKVEIRKGGLKVEMVSKVDVLTLMADQLGALPKSSRKAKALKRKFSLP